MNTDPVEWVDDPCPCEPLEEPMGDGATLSAEQKELQALSERVEQS